MFWAGYSFFFKKFIEESDLFEINVSALEKDGFIQGNYVAPSVLETEPENKSDECLCKISSMTEIDFTPNNYDVLDDEKGWRFLVLVAGVGFIRS